MDEGCSYARYTNDLSDLDNMFVHLTNVAIQKECARAFPKYDYKAHGQVLRGLIFNSGTVALSEAQRSCCVSTCVVT